MRGSFGLSMPASLGVLAGSVLVGVLAVQSWHLSVLYGEQGMDRVRHDPLVYERYCREIVQGHVPYRDFRVEYPPLAIPIWLGPFLISGRLGTSFGLMLAIAMALVNSGQMLAVAWWLGRRGESRQLLGRLTWYAVCFLALCPVALCRFDLVPAVVGFLAATCWSGDRPRWGGALAAIGTLVKLYPAALAGPGLAVDLRERSLSRSGMLVSCRRSWSASVAGSRWAGPGSWSRSAITPVEGSNPDRSTPGSFSSFVDVMACRCDGFSSTSPWSWKRLARGSWRCWPAPSSWPVSLS